MRLSKSESTVKKIEESMSKFAIGEKVWVERLNVMKARYKNFVQGPQGGMVRLPNGRCYTSDMECFGGGIHEITKVTNDGYILDGEERLIFTDEMLRKSNV